MTNVHEPRPGEVLGDRYYIEHELGRGGFGAVYRARQIGVEREVAVKVLHATYAAADAQAVDRFRREARIAATLSYPNTVRVFDYGETRDGVFYIVMEMVHGKPLGDVIARRGPMSPERAVHVIRQVLYALMEAHSQGIVHRDIKPENVMLVPLAYDNDYVKVMDFGIAKMVGEQGLTRAGLTLGTPRYMPVEQLGGKVLTPASDLYAVGLCLYEALLGEAAFKEEGSSAVDIAMAVMNGPSPRIEPGGAIPPMLCGVVNKACQKQPEARFQTAREFLEALEAWRPEIVHLPEAEDDGPRRTLERPGPPPAASRPAQGATVPQLEATEGPQPALPKTQLLGAKEPGRVSHEAPTMALELGSGTALLPGAEERTARDSPASPPPAEAAGPDPFALVSGQLKVLLPISGLTLLLVIVILVLSL